MRLAGKKFLKRRLVHIFPEKNAVEESGCRRTLSHRGEAKGRVLFFRLIFYVCSAAKGLYSPSLFPSHSLRSFSSLPFFLLYFVS